MSDWRKMKNLLFNFIPGTSFLHRLDPRVKVLAMLIASICIFRITTFREMLMIAAVFSLLMLLSSISLLSTINNVRPMLPFLVFLFILQLFLTRGQTLFSFLWMEATYQGLVSGALLSMRFLFLLLFASLLTSTTSPSLMSAGIERILRPLPTRKIGISSFDLATMMSLSLHFVPLLHGAFNKLRGAQVSRGLDMKRNPLRAIYSLSIPMIRMTLSSAEEVADAMESRCYHGEYRSSMHSLVMQKKDIAALLTFSTMMLVFI